MEKKLFILFLLVSTSLFSQSNDSLLSELDKRTGIERINLLHRLIYANWLNQPDDALMYAEEALNLSEETGNDVYISKSLRLLGGVYSYRNDYQSALDYVYQSLDIALKNQDSVNLSASYNNIGHMNINLGNYPDALEYLLRAKTIKERVGLDANMPLAYNNIGRVYYEMRDYSKAQENFTIALQKAQAVKDKNQVIYSLNNLSYAYLKQDSTLKAYDRLKQSLKLCENFTNYNWKSVALRGMGIAFLNDTQYDSAENCFYKSAALSGKIKDRIGVAEAYSQLALLNLKNNNTEEALKYVFRAQEVFEDVGAAKQIQDNLQLHMDIYAAQGERDNFQQYQRRLIQFKDSVLHRSTLRNMSLIPLKLKHEETTLRLLKNKAQLERTQFINVWYAIVIIITLPLLILVAFFYFKYRRSNKVLKDVNHEIAAQKEEIQTQNEELTEQGHELTAQRERLAEVNQLVSVKNEQLEEYASTLEKKIDHRSSQLAVMNKDLLNQNLKLEQFNFITVHNLRAPIAQILGLLDILPQRALEENEELVSITSKIKNSTNHLDEIVKDLNLILTIRKGTPDKVENISLNEELDVVIESLQPEIDAIRGEVILPKSELKIRL
ncbi:MAG: tetratricopeptide repeat protein [Bacteroidota bacterium]